MEKNDIQQWLNVYEYTKRYLINSDIQSLSVSMKRHNSLWQQYLRFSIIKESLLSSFGRNSKNLATVFDLGFGINQVDLQGRLFLLEDMMEVLIFKSAHQVLQAIQMNPFADYLIWKLFEKLPNPLLSIWNRYLGAIACVYTELENTIPEDSAHHALLRKIKDKILECRLGNLNSRMDSTCYIQPFSIEERQVIGRHPWAPDLFRSVIERNPFKVRCLIESGSNPDIFDGYSWNPVIVAIITNQPDMLSVLIDSGASVSLSDRLGFSPLDYTAIYLQPEMARHLIKAGANGFAQDYLLGMNSLMRFIIRNDLEIIKVMCDSLDLTSTNLADRTGETALSYATMYGREEVTTLLLNKGADPNSSNLVGQTPLIHAARGGSLGCLHECQRHGALLNTQDSRGWTALMYATKHHHTECVDFLLKSGCDPLDNKRKRTESC